MATSILHLNNGMHLTLPEVDWRDLVHLRISKHDTDIYRIIRDGFLLIPSDNFTRDYCNLIRKSYDLRFNLIEHYLFITTNEFEDEDFKIKIYLQSARFKPETDNFHLIASLVEPQQFALSVLNGSRESVLAECPLHHVVLAERAAQEALKEIEKDEMRSGH